MTFGVHSLVLIAAVGALLALIAVVVACRTRNGFVTAMMLLLVLVFMAPAAYVFLGFHPELVDDRFRRYKAFYRDIQIGMTRERVLAAMEAMERRYPANGPRKRPKILNDTAEGLGFSSAAR